MHANMEVLSVKMKRLICKLETLPWDTSDSDDERKLDSVGRVRRWLFAIFIYTFCKNLDDCCKAKALLVKLKLLQGLLLL